VFFFHHCRGQKLSCVSAHFDKYVGSSLFNFIVKLSSKKGNADKNSVSMAVGCMLLTFWSENCRAALINWGFDHVLSKNLPIMLALYQHNLTSYYAQSYAGILASCLPALSVRILTRIFLCESFITSIPASLLKRVFGKKTVIKYGFQANWFQQHNVISVLKQWS